MINIWSLNTLPHANFDGSCGFSLGEVVLVMFIDAPLVNFSYSRDFILFLVIKSRKIPLLGEGEATVLG
jgi:hypothetical protein